MKNPNLISKLKDLKKSKLLKNIEGKLLSTIRGGGNPCRVKCASNDGGNDIEQPKSL